MLDVFGEIKTLRLRLSGQMGFYIGREVDGDGHINENSVPSPVRTRKTRRF
jgi:hypothetical protein